MDSVLRKDEEVDYFEVFKLACLLHDIGHSPFSHTGERFFVYDDLDYSKIHKELTDLVSDENFKTDVGAHKTNAANPHEIMSAIIGLKQFLPFFSSVKARDFFARCITGYLFGDEEEREKILSSREKLLNCFISLLNSKVIDVDKLDYLIRDAFIIGYDTVKIDYLRLLGALTIVEDGDKYSLAFNKSAISVLENVVYARDSEKKWIQSHPVVLYENYIIQECMDMIVDEKGTKYFSSDSLSPNGTKCKGTFVRLLCDDDIITYIKSPHNVDELQGDNIAFQFFDRSQRMHSLWKSEAEFNALILKKLNDDDQKSFLETMSDMVSYAESETNKRVVIIDENYKNKIVEQRRIYEASMKSHPDEALSLKVAISRLERRIKLVDCLLDFAQENNMKKEFVVIPSDCFSSGFDSIDFVKMKIKFGERITSEFGEIVKTLNSKNSLSAEKVYFLYYYRKNDNICDGLCERIARCFMKY